jgi:hypothetical protein
MFYNIPTLYTSLKITLKAETNLTVDTGKKCLIRQHANLKILHHGVK